MFAAVHAFPERGGGPRKRWRGPRRQLKLPRSVESAEEPLSRLRRQPPFQGSHEGRLLNTREPLNSIILDIFPYIWYSVIRGFQHFKVRFGRDAGGSCRCICALGGGNLFLLFVDIPPSLELRHVRNRFSHQRAAHMRLLFSAIPSALSEISFLPLRS